MDNDYILFRLKGGDMKTFGQVFEDYHKLLYAYAYNLLRDGDEAKDAVQDVFAALCQNQKSWKSIVDVRSYLATSVRNRCLKMIRGRKNLEAVKNIEYLADMDSFEAEATTETINDHLEYVFDSILDAIPAKRRRIFLLYCFENYTYNEIGMKLGLTKNTIKTQLRLARQHVVNFRHLLTSLIIFLIV